MAGIYVHVPFCSQACHYCDFHFSTSRNTEHEVINAIKQEILIQKNYLEGELISTIYFGGGTPSLLNTSAIADILNIIKKCFNISKDLECTLEANPDNVKKNKIEEWVDAGINRISLGVQSFRDEDLQYMNRSHNAEDSRRAIKLLKSSSVKNINVDLIYGFPSLTKLAWINNLKNLLRFDVHHISCYCLTVEPNTPLFYFIKNKKEKALSPKDGRDHFLIARKILQDSGYDHYEISNFCKPKYQSIHNQNYWNRTKYLGVGPSAHSFNGVSRRWSVRNNRLYCNGVQDGSIYKEEILTRHNIINEYILTSIRTSSGLNVKNLKNTLKKSELNKFNLEINKLEKSNLIIFKDEMLYLSEDGMMLSDNIATNLFVTSR